MSKFMLTTIIYIAYIHICKQIMVSKDHPNYKPHGAKAGTDPKPFAWTEKKYEIAADLAEGKYGHMEIAAMYEVHNQTISSWKQNIEFMAYVDKLTLEFELATRAGLLRECYLGIQQKRNEILSDKTTHLDYVKSVADIQGFKKSEVALGGEVKIDVSTEEALRKYEDLLAKLSK